MKHLKFISSHCWKLHTASINPELLHNYTKLLASIAPTSKQLTYICQSSCHNICLRLWNSEAFPGPETSQMYSSNFYCAGLQMERKTFRYFVFYFSQFSIWWTRKLHIDIFYTHNTCLFEDELSFFFSKCNKKAVYHRCQKLTLYWLASLHLY